MKLNQQEYQDKVQGCWMGKGIGNTLGLPFEWKRKINNVSFYTQDTHDAPFPSVDMDIQLLWLRALEDHGVHIGTPILSEYFLSYLTTHVGEYGPAKASLKVGLMPPLNSMESDYRHSCGGFIRSEIWACIAPGCPEIAARNAYQDAIIDHGDGEGLYAAMLMAVIQSSAFIENDIYKLLDIGLSYIPEDCGVANAVRCVIDCFLDGHTWYAARDKVLQEHRGHYATWEGAGISQRDWENDLAYGVQGYDAPSNIGMILIGWLYGEGDFGHSICITVNCGEDTDSNAATLGALLGILGGASHIPENWLAPISRRIRTKIHDINRIPESVKELTNRVERLAKIIMLTYRPDVELTGGETIISKRNLDSLANVALGERLLRNPRGPIHESGLITCALDYRDGAYITPGGTTRIALRVGCKLKHELFLQMKWYLPKGFSITPTPTGMIHCPGGGKEAGPYVFEIISEGPVELINRFVIEFTSPGRHIVGLAPVVLLDGGLKPL